MCFSAGASFAGGALIAATGVLTVSANNDPSRRLFAAVPMIFGVQQISEGFVWVALQSPGNETMLAVASWTFLLAAVVLWPSYIPLSVLAMEPNGKRRRWLMPFLALGILTSLYYGTGLLIHDWEPKIMSHHIRYVNNFPRHLANPFFITYLLATLTPLFISGRRGMWLMAVLMFISCLITGIFYKEYLTSVWCFFAAIISAVILWIIKHDGQPVPENRSSQNNN